MIARLESYVSGGKGEIDVAIRKMGFGILQKPDEKDWITHYQGILGEIKLIDLGIAPDKRYEISYEGLESTFRTIIQTIAK